jgi:hypothetical protein
MDRMKRALWILSALSTLATASLGCKGPPPTTPAVIARELNRLLWGDTHVHTSLSAHAQPPGHRSADPDTAYRWAEGLPVVDPYTGARIQLQTPLDFLVVADHAERLGTAAWSSTIEAAERHYAPCAFTTFVGWEWTSELNGHGLHRVVFMNDGAKEARELVPFSALDSPRPEDLWNWLEQTSTRVGTDFIAIPHNSKLSDGRMYPELDSDGLPIAAAYAQTRMRWEPVAEVTHIKGDFETDPVLSPEDEFAEFEAFSETAEGSQADASKANGDYARAGLLRGLQIGQSVGANPFRFAMVGSTGSDAGLASADEAHFWGASPSELDTVSAQGLTAVWAEENTRTSIFDAFKRKEVYATTGPRIRVRFFGGWNFNAKQAGKANMVNVGYTFGYPMGSDLAKAPEGKAPAFLMYAVKDPEGPTSIASKW